MATIASTITLRDNMTAVLNRQAGAANNLLHRFTQLDRETESCDPSGQFISANSAILEMNANLGVQTTLLQQQNSLLANMAEQSVAATREANNSKDAWSGVGNAIKAAMSFISVKPVKGFVDSVFELNNTQLKTEVQLATVMKNQGSGVTDFEAIKNRASDIQGSTMYGDEAMISGAAELSTYISDTEAISHMMGTLANYAAGMSGGSEVGVEAMTEYATQLGKALDGTYDGLKKKGFELTEEQQKIIENGTDMQKALVLDEVINQSWEGLAENMRNTPTGAITSLNNTIGDIGETIGARITPAFLKLAQKVDKFVNSSGFESMVDSLVVVLNVLFDTLNRGAEIVQWIGDNWSVIEVIIIGVAAAVIAYNAVKAVQNALDLAGNGIKSLAAIAAVAHGAAVTDEMLATTGMTKAQLEANAAMLACPITWLILAIGGLVGAMGIYADYANKTYGTTLSISGVIGGSLMVILSAAGNLMIDIANIFIGAFDAIWNMVADFANFFGNVFTNPVGAAWNLWESWFDNMMTGILHVTGMIDNLFGTDYTSQLTQFRDTLFQAVESQYGDQMDDTTEYMTHRDYKKDLLKRIDYREAFDLGYDLTKDLFGGDSNNPFDPKDFLPPDDSPDGSEDDPLHTSVDNDVNIADEDLQLMRDVAEARYVQNFVTLTPTVQVSGNTINERVDVGQVVDEIENRLTNEIAASAEGIYE